MTKPFSETEQIRAFLERVGHWRPEFEAKVQELVDLRKARRDALARAQETPTVKGSMGQERENPAWDLVLKFQFAIDRLTDQLLLSPKAANQAGIKTETDELAGLLGE